MSGKTGGGGSAGGRGDAAGCRWHKTCGARMEIPGHYGKTFTCRPGKVTVRRRRVHCRDCGNGHYPPDRHLGIEGGGVTPGAAGVIADIVGDDSCEASSRKLRNTAGIMPGSSSIDRRAKRNSGSLQRFEREEVIPGEPSSARGHVSIDGTGVPMRKEETAGIRGRQEDGSSKTREARVISDGASWIGNVCKELFCGRPVTYILDMFHLSEYLSDALKAIIPGAAERRQRFEADKARLKDNRAAAVIEDLRPHADRHEAVATCVKYMESNISRMQYGTYIKRGLHIGSGVVESACRSLVCMRLKQPGNHWSVAGANAILLLRSCIRNNRWADYLDWKAAQSRMA